MPGLFVHHIRPAFNAFLRAWGRHGNDWWALIVWDQRVRTRGAVHTVSYAAWVPADRVAKPAWSAGDKPTRMVLPAERDDWPPPVDWEGSFVGPWTSDVIPMRPGTEVVTGPAWRE